MLKTKVGYSENTDAYTSGMETAKMANVIDNAQAGLFFTSCNQNQEELMKGAKSVLGNVDLIGCTSSAALCTQDGYLNKETGYSAMMLIGGDCTISCAGSKKTEESAREIGKRLAKEAVSKKGLKQKPDYFFMCASPAEEEEYLKGIQDVIGDVPVFGGSSADNTVEGKWSIFYNDEIFADGCVIALIYSSSKITNLYTGNYEETENSGVITKISGKRCLVEIDHEPALKVYAKWNNKDVETLKGGALLSETITAPLGVKDQIGNVIAVRHPMFGNDDYSMNIGANLALNTAVIGLKNTPEGILNASNKAIEELNTLADNNINSYFLVHCGGRRLGLAIAGIENRIYEETKKSIPDKEFLMVFTFGEYGRREHSSNIVGGLSLSYTGFGE